MNTPKPTPSILSALALAALAALAVPTAQAALMSSDIKDGTRDTGWKMGYDDSQVQFLGFSGNATGILQGTLSITKVFSSLAPITISFKEIAPAATNNFGLRINIAEEITNLSGFDWCAFRFDLIDNNALSTHPTGSHPGFAHFHAGGTYPPFSVTGGEDAENFINLGNGIFANGATESWGGIKIHQFEDIGLQRDFTMVETPSPCPVPEPASLAVGLLCLGVGIAARRRRKA